MIELLRLAEFVHPEEDYQSWFEKHPVIFDSYGYDLVLPHPQLQSSDGRLYVPDFLARGLDGTWEIIEIKRPDTHVLRDTERRHTFYATLESYYAQCREYSQFFDDAAHRGWFEATFGHRIHRDVRAVLVAGADKGLDRQRAHQLLTDRGGKVNLQTYNDVLERVEFFRQKQFGRYENLPGMSSHSIVQLHPVPGRRSFFLDIGESAVANRVSLWMNDQSELFLQVTETSGHVRTLRAATRSKALRDTGFMYLVFEVGVGEERAMLSVEINGVLESYVLVERDQLEFRLPLNIVVGSDMSGTEGVHMCLFTTRAYPRTLTFAQRNRLAGEYLESMARGRTAYLEYHPGHFMVSRAHPHFDLPDEVRLAGAPTDLVTPDVARKPVFRRSVEPVRMTVEE